MRRRLVRQGKQALTVTLPIEWLREHKLESGDEVEVDVEGNNLVIHTSRLPKTAPIELDFSTLPRKLQYVSISAAYARGIDGIDLRAPIPLDLTALMGYAAISQKNDRYEIRDISGISTDSVDDVFRRVFQMIIGFYESALADMYGNLEKDDDTICRADDDINKFTLFLQRAVMKHAHGDTSEGRILFAYAFALEQIGDEVTRIWRVAREYGIHDKKRSKEITDMALSALEKAFQVCFQDTQEKAKALLAIKESIRKKSNALIKDVPRSAPVVMHAVRIVEDAHDLTHLALMRRLSITH